MGGGVKKYRILHRFSTPSIFDPIFWIDLYCWISHCPTVNSSFDNFSGFRFSTLCVVYRLWWSGHILFFDCCRKAFGVTSWERLWSASWWLLIVPHYWISTMGFLCGWPVGVEFFTFPICMIQIGRNALRQHLKTFTFASYWCVHLIRFFNVYLLYKYTLTNWRSGAVVSCGHPARTVVRPEHKVYCGCWTRKHWLLVQVKTLSWILSIRPTVPMTTPAIVSRTVLFSLLFTLVMLKNVKNWFIWCHKVRRFRGA